MSNLQADNFIDLFVENTMGRDELIFSFYADNKERKEWVKLVETERYSALFFISSNKEFNGRVYVSEDRLSVQDRRTIIIKEYEKKVSLTELLKIGSFTILGGNYLTFPLNKNEYTKDNISELHINESYASTLNNLFFKKKDKFTLRTVKQGGAVRENIVEMMFLVILGMGIGSALNGLYHGERIDKLNESILEFNIAVETTYNKK